MRGNTGYAPKKARTQADRRLDRFNFLAMARPEMVARATPEMLAARYDVPIDFVRERMAAREVLL